MKQGIVRNRQKKVRYVGTRADGVITVWKERGGKREMWALMPDDQSQKLGCSDSRQARLALAVLTDAVGWKAASHHCHHFSADVISRLDPDSWELDRAKILSWYKQNRLPHADIEKRFHEGDEP
jgi:hypothetical protein